MLDFKNSIKAKCLSSVELIFCDFLYLNTILLSLSIVIPDDHPLRRKLEGGRGRSESFICVKWEAGIVSTMLIALKMNNKMYYILWLFFLPHKTLLYLTSAKRKVKWKE